MPRSVVFIVAPLTAAIPRLGIMSQNNFALDAVRHAWSVPSRGIAERFRLFTAKVQYFI